MNQSPLYKSDEPRNVAKGRNRKRIAWLATGGLSVVLVAGLIGNGIMQRNLGEQGQSSGQGSASQQRDPIQSLLGALGIDSGPTQAAATPTALTPLETTGTRSPAQLTAGLPPPEESETPSRGHGTPNATQRAATRTATSGPTRTNVPQQVGVGTPGTLTSGSIAAATLTAISAAATTPIAGPAIASTATALALVAHTPTRAPTIGGIATATPLVVRTPTPGATAIHTFAPTATPGPAACAPLASQVSLYADTNYRGACITLGVGEYGNPGWEGALGNDNAESIRVGSSVQAILYQEYYFGGAFETFRGDYADLAGSAIGANRVSSVKVQLRSSAATPTSVPGTATPTHAPPTSTPVSVPPTDTPVVIVPSPTPTSAQPTVAPTTEPATDTPVEVPPTGTPTP